VHGPENLVQEAQVGRILLQLQEVRLDGLEVLLGFDEEIRK